LFEAFCVASKISEAPGPFDTSSGRLSNMKLDNSSLC
jgi:hypothetical protein